MHDLDDQGTLSRRPEPKRPSRNVTAEARGVPAMMLSECCRKTHSIQPGFGFPTWYTLRTGTYCIHYGRVPGTKLQTDTNPLPCQSELQTDTNPLLRL